MPKEDSGKLNFFSKFTDKELEEKFHGYHLKNEAISLKWIVLASGMLSLLFLLHDIFYIPEASKLYVTIVIRILYFLWAIIFFFICSHSSNYALIGKLKNLTEVLFIYSLIQILYILKYQNFDSHSMIMIIVFIILSVVSSDWIQYVISVSIYTLLYFGTSALYLIDYSCKDYMTAAVYFLIAILFGTFEAYQGCRHRRLVFFQNLLIERVRKVNDEKSNLIETEKIKTLTLLEQEQMISKINGMAFMRSQMKPCFINDALKTIEQLCYDTPQKAAQLITRLSDYLAYSLDYNNDMQVVPLENELKLIYAYVDIEKALFSDCFVMEYEISNTSPFYLPPMLIKSLIENAIKHGVGRKSRQDIIKLIIREEKDRYYLCVEDNGVGISEEEQKNLLIEHKGYTGAGLGDSNSRLTQMYGEKLYINSEEGHGTKVFFYIPKIAGDYYVRNSRSRE